jgi:hypothetical protein
MERRLARLDLIYRRRSAPRFAAQTFDLSRLTQDERLDLDDVLAKLDGLPPRPNGRPDLSPLSDEELERVAELSEKMQEVAYGQAD